MDVLFLGRKLGTASGWDGDPGECFWVYDFVPNWDGMELSQCDCLQIDEANAKIHTQDKEGNNLQSFTIEWSIKQD